MVLNHTDNKKYIQNNMPKSFIAISHSVTSNIAHDGWKQKTCVIPQVRWINTLVTHMPNTNTAVMEDIMREWGLKRAVDVHQLTFTSPKCRLSMRAGCTWRGNTAQHFESVWTRSQNTKLVLACLITVMISLTYSVIRQFLSSIQTDM